MTETIAAMMDLIPTATPRQLADLSALLESDASRVAPPTPAASLTPSAPADNAPVVHPVTTETSVYPDRGTMTTGALANGVSANGALANGAFANGLSGTGTSTREAPAAGTTAREVTAREFTAREVTARETTARETTAGPVVDRGLAAKATIDPGIAPSRTTDRATMDRGAVTAPAPAAIMVRPSPRALELFARGQQAERAGDVSGARRFYATAAEQGSANAARSLGRLYDPGYLRQTALGGIDPDPALARRWYERAVAMGDAQAAPLLQALAAR